MATRGMHVLAASSTEPTSASPADAPAELSCAAASSTEPPSASPADIESLPAELLCAIFAHALPRDHANLARVSWAICSAVKSIRTAWLSADARALGTPLSLALRGLHNLQELHLRSCDGMPLLTDNALISCAGAPLGSLEVIDLRYQPALSSKGLRVLAPSMPCLRAVDLTFCPAIGYAVVWQLRQTCKRLVLVRRVPVSLTGWVKLPSMRSGPAGAAAARLVHYWADGSFALEGPLELGWVAQLSRHADGTLESRMSFCDEEPGLSPDNGRLGGLFRRVDDGRLLTEAETAAAEARAEAAIVTSIREAARTAPESSGRALPREAGFGAPLVVPPPALLPPPVLPPAGGLAREVLVVQSTRWPEPPSVFPAICSSDWPPLGERVRGSALGRQHDGVLQGLSIARLALQPLPLDAQLPPKGIGLKLRRFCGMHPDARREYERRARASMGRLRCGADRAASMLSALQRGLAAGAGGASEPTQAAVAVWHVASSSSESDDE